jgi:hypothetical protein
MMTSISPTTSQTTTSTNTSTQATTQESAVSEDTETAPVATSDQVALSSRASKIQKLNEEFFPGGPKTVSITPEFIQRLSEYGLISSEEAQKLDGTSRETSQEADPLEDISLFIDDLSKQISQEDPQSSLIDTLSKAKTVIDGFGINTAAMNSDIKTIMAELNEFKQSEHGQQMSNDDKGKFEQLELALSVADQMNPQNSSSEQLANYVSIYNQYQE